MLSHAMAGGLLSVGQTGSFSSFKSGFISAGVSQGFSASGLYDFAGKNPAANAIVAAAVGGTASKLTGGDFANGARTAAFARIFNDSRHEHAQEGNLVSVEGKTKVSLGFSDVAGGMAQHAYVLVEGPDGQV